VKEDEENKLSWVFYDLNEKDFLAGIFCCPAFFDHLFLVSPARARIFLVVYYVGFRKIMMYVLCALLCL
jgi:hypothetical protein